MELKHIFAEKLKAAVTRPNIYGYQPHAKQQLFHASTNKGTIFIGGNRSGKTVSGATEVVRAALGIDPHEKYPPPPLRIRAVTVDRKQGINKIVIPELAKWIPPSALKGGSWDRAYSKDDATITFDNGSFIEILTYEQDVEKHAGTSRHLIWFDEEPPEAIFNEGLGRLIDTGGRWLMTITPVEGIEFIYDFWQRVEEDGEDLGITFIQVDSDENPHIAAHEVDALFVGLSPEDKLTRKKGQFKALGKKVYDNFDERVHVFDHREFDPSPNWIRINAMDHGFHAPTCWLFAWVDPSENVFYIYDELYQNRTIVEEWCKLVQAKEARYGVPLYRVGDPAIKQRSAVNGASIQSAYADFGIYIALGNNDVPTGLNRVRTLLGEGPGSDPPRLFISDLCTNLSSELRRYRFEDWANKKVASQRNVKETPVKKNDHAPDTLRYLVCAWMDWKEHVPADRLITPLGVSASRPNMSASDWDDTPSRFVHPILGEVY